MIFHAANDKTCKRVCEFVDIGSDSLVGSEKGSVAIHLKFERKEIFCLFIFSLLISMRFFGFESRAFDDGN